MKDVVIFAPHPDDEVIGCYSFLDRVSHIFFGALTPQEELRRLSNTFGCHTEQIADLNHPRFPSANLYLFPDPYFEVHPLHRRLGMMGETLLRGNPNNRSHVDVIFYSVNMQAPYIFEVPHPEKKRKLLDATYPEKADLWKYDHKYFLFEGYCKWAIEGRFRCD